MMAFSKPRPNMAFEDDKEDEDISIDFSKITGIFKRKKEKQKLEENKEEKTIEKDENEKDDGEVNVDLGKIKNIFKKRDEKEKIKDAKKEAKKIETDEKVKEVNEIISGKKEVIKEIKEEAKEEEEDDISLDFGKIKNIFKRKERTEKEEKTKEEDEGIKEDDDEVSFDFGKLKDIFKGKKEASKKEEEVQKKEDDEEDISLDFGKIKSFFKKKEEPEKKEESKEEAINIADLSNFYNKYKHIIAPLIIILFAMYLSAYLRIQPAYLPVTDDWATNSVHSYFRSQIMDQINKQYPNLPEANKNVLVDAEFQKLLEQQKPQVEEQIKGTSDFFKSKLQDDRGYPYLGDIDTYFWWRYAENVLKNGHPGDELRNPNTGELCYKQKKDCVPWDNHMSAPKGYDVTPDQFHAYFEAFVYRIVHFFNNNITLKDVVFFISALIVALAIIPAFFIAKGMAGNFAGAIAAIVIAINPFLLTRTAGGVADTDPYNVLFPLLITWAYIESLKSKNIIKKIALVASSGLLAGFYSFAWSGWWFIFDFIIAASIIYLACSFLISIKDIKKGLMAYIGKPEIKSVLISMLVFIISSALFVTIFRDYDTFGEIWRSPLGFTKIKEVAVSRIWPNVMTTVAEQNEASFYDAISGIGGNFLFFISLIGVILIMRGKEGKKARDIWFIIPSIIWMYIILAMKLNSMVLFFVLLSLPVVAGLILFIREGYNKINISIAILLVIWYLSTMYATTKGIRWTLLLVPAFSIAFGVALGKIYKYLSSIAIKELSINKIIAKSIVLILLCLLLIGPWNSAKSIAKQGIPIVNDAWWDSLEKIKMESKPDAIINSWWDFGHWFKAIADRAVTFDGTTQDSPEAHWIGNALLTDDEDTAIGILKMLDCGATDAFNELNKKINDTAHSIEILHEIITKDKNGAKKILLKHNISEEHANLILTKTHCEPPEDYFIASEDMVSKSGVWSHFGSWDFDKAQIYFTLNKEEYSNNKEASIDYLKERFGYSNDEASNIYYEVKSLAGSSDVNSWIAPWPSYGGTSSCDKKDEFSLVCSNGIEVDLKNNEAFTLNQNKEKLYPKSFVIPIEDGSLITKEYNKSLLTLQNGRPLGAVLISEGESYSLLIMDYALTGSMFTKLFYMDGHSLTHFRKFSDEKSVFNNRIIVYKVDWKGNETNIMEHFKILKEKELKEKEEKEKAAINQSSKLLNESINIPGTENMSNES